MSEKWPRYPISPELLDGIKGLFANVEDGLQILGLNKRVVPGSWYRQPDRSLPALERARALRFVLEKYLIQMSKENREYENPSETDRLRTEAIGILLALRELWLHIPEVGDA